MLKISVVWYLCGMCSLMRLTHNYGKPGGVLLAKLLVLSNTSSSYYLWLIIAKFVISLHSWKLLFIHCSLLFPVIITCYVNYRMWIPSHIVHVSTYSLYLKVVDIFLCVFVDFMWTFMFMPVSCDSDHYISTIIHITSVFVTSGIDRSSNGLSDWSCPYLDHY